MGVACNTHERIKKFMQIWPKKLKTGREDNIKMQLYDIVL
jgi:hypothetical protein